MAYSQADVDTLQAAIATGALTVRSADGRLVTYRSLDEMKRILQEVRDAVTPSAAGSRTSYATFCKD